MTGFVVIDKERGVSSAHEVARVKRLTGERCGHMGTLDPMACGVLPVAIGNACRLFDYFLDKKKLYRATFEFGADSETLDSESTVFRGGRIPSADEISAALGGFCGEIMQVPPRYSAKNVNGRRGYELARENKDFVLPPKKVIIYSIKLLGQVDESSYSFEIECGGGTYIRSVARDLGAALGTTAVMTSLLRLKSGIFTIDMAIRSAALDRDSVRKHLIPTESVLPFDAIRAESVNAKKLFNGLTVDCGLSDGLYKLYDIEDCFYGIAEVKNKKLRIRIKLC